MAKKSENVNENKTSKSLEEVSQKLKSNMLYYFKSKQSYENLFMFVMDV